MVSWQNSTWDLAGRPGSGNACPAIVVTQAAHFLRVVLTTAQRFPPTFLYLVCFQIFDRRLACLLAGGSVQP